MTYGSPWTRDQLLIAFALYCRLPFENFQNRNPEVIRFAEAIGRTPSSMSMRLGNIASLDPDFTSTGRTGLRGVSEELRTMWEEMHSDWGSFVTELERATREANLAAESDGGTERVLDDDHVVTERETQTEARVGQGFFRAAVLSAYNWRCCITGLAIPALLVASHIVPWSHNKSNRLNPRNGLCLSALHDRAFDIGMITVNKDMSVAISKHYTASNDDFFSMSIAS